MQDGSAKQQIVEHIKSAANILVTVSTNPTVDELSAALGFTLMLNKLDKHATAVFSGEVPHALQFLKPDKTFENTVDSLRDFIIALDKEKADRLRYKVEDDVVRIFITPYRTTITEKDLQFSQGDFNVDLIVALGVEKSDDLDKAIAAHGRILHDATVVAVNASGSQSSLGSIDWNDANASSLCEMLMSLSEALQPNLLDEQIANSLLTGIVAATERFSNQRTTPKVMTMSAQLMAAGANQQLIATKLQEDHVIGGQKSNRDGSTDLSDGSASNVKKQTVSNKKDKPKNSGEMQVSHDPAQAKAKAAEEEAESLAKAAEEELQQKLESTTPAATSPQVNLSQALAQEENEIAAAAPEGPSLPAPAVSDQPDQSSQAPVYHEPKIKHDNKPSWMSRTLEPPTMGSPLSATTQEALDAANKEQQENRNKPILKHDDEEVDQVKQDRAPFSSSPLDLQFEEAPINLPPEPVSSQPEPAQPDNVQPLADTTQQPTDMSVGASEPTAAAIAPLAPDLDEARRAVNDALSMTPVAPVASNPVLDVTNLSPQPLPQIPTTDFSPAPESVVSPAPQPPLADQNPPQFMPSELPPLPDFNTLPPLPSTAAPETPAPVTSDSSFIDPNAQGGVPTPPPLPNVGQQPAAPTDPGQFRIPGQ